MTPHELTQIRLMIQEAVRSTVKSEIALAVQPLQDQIDVLKRVDETHDSRLAGHSGAHKDIVVNVRKSLSEVQEATLETVDAKLDSLRAEMRAERAELVRTPAVADAAKTAAIQASTAAASASIDTTQIRSKQTAEAHDQRIRFWITIIPVVAAAIASIAKVFL